MDVPCFYYLQEHLEDKNLRQILLESETSAYYAQFDADSSSRKGGTSTKWQPRANHIWSSFAWLNLD